MHCPLPRKITSPSLTWRKSRPRSATRRFVASGMLSRSISPARTVAPRVARKADQLAKTPAVADIEAFWHTAG